MLGQCTHDQTPHPTSPQLAARSLSANQELSGEEAQAAQQLAANPDFRRLVEITNGFQDVLYNNLRDAKGEATRVAKLNRLGQLLNSKDDKDSLVLAIHVIGFNDLNQFLLDISEVDSIKVRMSRTGNGLEKISVPVMIQARSIVSHEIGYSYPNIANKSEVCPLCFFNNCSECNSGTEVETPNTDDGGSGYNCRDNARAQRQIAIEQADSDLLRALLLCVPSAVGAGAASCTGFAVTIVGAPISPAVGVGVGCVVFVGCDVWALVDHERKLRLAELQYQAAVANCPK